MQPGARYQPHIFHLAVIAFDESHRRTTPKANLVPGPSTQRVPRRQRTTSHRPTLYRQSEKHRQPNTNWIERRMAGPKVRWLRYLRARLVRVSPHLDHLER